MKKSYSKNIELVKNSFLAVNITNAKKTDILEFIVKSIENTRDNYYITTPNPEMVVYATSHPDFAHILNASRLALCDGVGLLWASKVLGVPLTQRFTGVEALEKLCEKVANLAITVGFLGGEEGVAEKTAECLLQKYPDLKVVYASDQWPENQDSGLWGIGYGQGQTSSESKTNHKSYAISHKKSIPDSIINRQSSMINGIDILFVALGFPKQEEWMASHLNKIPVRVMMGVGGAFNYISGKVGRAPRWVQNIGMEWLYRLVREPWRIKRQLALPVFVWMVLKERLFS